MFKTVFVTFTESIGHAATSSDALDVRTRTERRAAAVAVPAACNYSRHSILHAHAFSNTNKLLVARGRTHVRCRCDAINTSVNNRKTIKR
ncbi:unnamed protein product [Arctia plantaginis]|uniref:Uncharacterized protein n=1 Tax=Arctia plantaginis TaxID=874455 RepID=A0A8S0ZRF0_ARCPL|nr:unnamed protein product [Arctia plantaginis]